MIDNAPVRKHYAIFLSPGTFVSETNTEEVPSWDTAKAAEVARNITQRHGAKPYGFYFETRLIAQPISDGQGGTMEVKPKVVDTSPGIYYLSGTLETFDQIEARNDPKEEILRSNMRSNDNPIVVINTNSYRSTMPFRPQDIVIDPSTGAILERGDDPKYVAYREESKAKFKAYYDDLDKKWKAKHGHDSV